MNNDIYINKEFKFCNCYNQYLQKQNKLKLFVTIEMENFNHFPKFEYCPFCGTKIFNEDEIIELGESQPINKDTLNKISKIAKFCNNIKDISDELEFNDIWDD